MSESSEPRAFAIADLNRRLRLLDFAIDADRHALQAVDPDEQPDIHHRLRMLLQQRRRLRERLKDWTAAPAVLDVSTDVREAAEAAAESLRAGWTRSFDTRLPRAEVLWTLLAERVPEPIAAKELIGLLWPLRPAARGGSAGRMDRCGQGDPRERLAGLVRRTRRDMAEANAGVTIRKVSIEAASGDEPAYVLVRAPVRVDPLSQVMTEQETLLLAVLSERYPDSMTTAELASGLWDDVTFSRLAALRVHIRNLREKLKAIAAPVTVQALQGKRYKLINTPENGTLQKTERCTRMSNTTIKTANQTKNVNGSNKSNDSHVLRRQELLFLAILSEAAPATVTFEELTMRMWPLPRRPPGDPINVFRVVGNRVRKKLEMELASVTVRNVRATGYVLIPTFATIAAAPRIVAQAAVVPAI